MTILVIDNNSRPDQTALLKSKLSPENLILNNKNLGYGEGNNIGIEIALQNGADYIWVLNPDIRPTNDALIKLIETINKDPKLAAVGPRILRREDPEVIFTDGEKLYFDERCLTEHKNSGLNDADTLMQTDYDIDYIDGSCILIRADAIKQLGPFPKEYFLYFEETHWCFSAKIRGWSLAVNSEAKVFNLTSLKKETFHFYFMRNKLIFSKIFHKDFDSVRRYYLYLLYDEFKNRLLGKANLKPYFKNRVFGYLRGVLKTL